MITTQASRPRPLFPRIALALIVAGMAGCSRSCLGFGTPSDDDASPRRADLIRAELVPFRIDYQVTPHDELAATLKASDRSHLNMFPKGSRVGLQLRLTNVSYEPVTIAYPSGCYDLRFELQGRGVVFAEDLRTIRFPPPRRGTRRVLNPRESFEIDIPYLELDQYEREWRAYLTQTSSVMTRAIFEARCTDPDLAYVVAMSPQIEIRVRK